MTFNVNKLSWANICLIIIFYCVYYNRYYIYDYIQSNRYNTIIIEGTRTCLTSSYISRYDNIFSDKFRAIWFYVNNNLTNLNIKSVKELVTNSIIIDTDKVNSYANNNSYSYIVNQAEAFELFKDVYCKVTIINNDLQQDNKKNISTTEQNIYLTIYSKKYSLNHINNLINNLVKEHEKTIKNIRGDKLFIYSLISRSSNNDDGYCRDNKFSGWQEVEFSSNKNFNNLFFPHKKYLLNKIDFFSHNEKYYNNHGIPYTLGISLEGPPGTGKTSIIKSLANYLKRHLIIINMNKIKTNEELDQFFYESTYSNNNKQNSINFEDKIYVFEDIDCCIDIIKQRKKEKINKN